VKLRRGVTLKGRVVGPDGKPAAGALMFSSMNFRVSPFTWRGEPVSLRGSEFELYGCDPDQTYRVHFLDVASKLGAVAEVSPPKAGREPVTVRLAPCGTAVVSVRDFLDRPVRLGRRYCGPHLLISPGTFRLAAREEKVFAQGGLYAEDIEPRRYLRGVETEEFDDQGRITCHYLIPGATYHLWWWVDRKGGRHREFKVKPGESLKLPDIVYAEGEVP
jgi:hypothetical protein